MSSSEYLIDASTRHQIMLAVLIGFIIVMLNLENNYLEDRLSQCESKSKRATDSAQCGASPLYCPAAPLLPAAH